MTNRNALLWLPLLLTAHATAQVRLGIEAGADFPGGSGYSRDVLYYFGGTMRVQTSGSGGPLFGIFASAPLNKQVYLRPLADLAFRGFKQTSTPPAGSTGSAYSYTDDARYLDFALPVAYRFSTKATGFYAGAGPAISVLLSKQYGPTPVKSATAGLTGWLGYVFPLDFSLNAGYHLGLTNSLSNATDGSSYKDGFFNITLGYLF